jgi:ubiquinone biosynthesis accessory factor UbiJ
MRKNQAPELTMPSLVDFIVPLLNHLLERENWGRQRLLPFAGQAACIAGLPFALTMTVSDSGIFRPAGADEEAAVTIELPTDAPFRMLGDPSSVFAAARLSGAANFAETLAFVFRNLRWDYEADLAAIIGDIPGRRLAKALADGLAWHRSAAQRLGMNAAEFATEEAQLVTSRRDLMEFARAVDQVRDDLARLEKRISRLAS